jgi:Raf kinase inhibitor-like YbhB/YbcL family protein
MLSINIKSTNDELMDDKYTCVGLNVSPPISWSKGPNDTKSYAITIYDVDAKPSGFWHWIMFNIDKDITSINENEIPTGSFSIKNDFGKLNYGGPCPPIGSENHRYIISVYALNNKVDKNKINTIEDVKNILNNEKFEIKIIGKGHITKNYHRTI